MLVRDLFVSPYGTPVDGVRCVTLEAEIEYARTALVDIPWTARLTKLFNTSDVRRLIVTRRTLDYAACDAELDKYKATPENVCVCEAMNEIVVFHETAIPSASHPPVQGTTACWSPSCTCFVCTWKRQLHPL